MIPFVVESVYGYDDYIYSGSKSLYTPSSRPSNLHRSQSVCTRPLPQPNEQKVPATSGLLHNNIVVYNEQQHLPNNIDKQTSVPPSLYSKNIPDQQQMLPQYSTSKSKSNLIKPEPLYKGTTNQYNNHIQQQTLHNNLQPYTQQSQNYQNQSQNYQNQRMSQERCGSVLSSVTSGNVKYHPGEDDDSSQYNFRGFGRNRPDLHTPGSLQSELTLPPSSMAPYSHYGTHGDKFN